MQRRLEFPVPEDDDEGTVMRRSATSAGRGAWRFRSRPRLTLGPLVLLVACQPRPARLAPVPVQAAIFVVRNARVFDGDRVLPRASVLVRDGRIAAVGPEIETPLGAEEVDGSGKTLLPGLIDAHGHVRGGALREQLVFGVTTVLDMSTDAAWAAAMRREQRGGQGLDRADLYSAGTLITAPHGHGTEYQDIPTISSPGQAQGVVDARIAEGSDYIKIVYDDGRSFGPSIPTIDRPTLKAVVDASHARRRLAVVHIGSVAGARDALEAGADGLVHLSPEQAVDEDLVALARRRRAFIVPTLSLNESLCGIASGASLLADPRVAPYLSAFSAKNLVQSYHLHPPRDLDFGAALTSVARLNAAGVPILAGTDAPNRGTAHGASLHRELELLVRAGLSPVEALRAATSVPAGAFALPDRGRVAAGLRADLLLVQGDPTRDILATRDIVAIWKLGRRVDREGYRVGLGLGDRRWTLARLAVLAVALAVAVLAVRRRAQRRAAAGRG
jgi:imidazolonepropionase-like amidohydrolase